MFIALHYSSLRFEFLKPATVSRIMLQCTWVCYLDPRGHFEIVCDVLISIIAVLDPHTYTF